MLSFVLSIALAQAPAQEATLRIAPVAIVDVARGVVAADRAITVRGGRILAVTAAAEPLEDGVTLVDGGGRYAVPGLIDAHVHLNDPEREARLFVAHGVVLARDMGGPTRQRLELRERARRGELFGLDLVVTGTLIDGSPPYHAWTEAVCTTPEEGRRAARELAAAGVDQLKVYARLAPDVFAAILAEGRALGKQVVGHVPDAVTLLDAAQAGLASDEHLTRVESLFADLTDLRPAPSAGYVFGGGWWQVYRTLDEAALDAALARLAATGMVQCPTLVLNASYGRIPPDPATRAAWDRFVSPDDVRAWTTRPEAWGTYVDSAAAAWPDLLDLVGRMHRAGNVLLVGTDLGNPYAVAGVSVHAELAYLTEAGLTPAEALRAATLDPARFLGVDDRLGEIAAGKEASFFLVDEDPLADVRAARDPVSVWVRGRQYDAAALADLEREAERMMLATAPGDDPGPLEAPAGDALVRATLVHRYGEWDDGREEFVVASKDGERLARSSILQRGFGRVPLVVESRHAPDGALRALSWTTSALAPTRGTAIRGADGRWSASFVRDGVERPLALAADVDLVLPPAGVAQEALALRGLGLAPGESRRLTVARLDAAGRAPQSGAWDVELRVEERGAQVRYVLTQVDGSEVLTLAVDPDGTPTRRELAQGEVVRSATRGR